MTNSYLQIIIFTFFLVFSFNSYGQGASIHGKVYEKGNSEGLFGVNIVLEGTVHGTISAAHGEYNLEGIPGGSHVILFSSVGYKTIKKTVDIPENGKFELDITMEPGAIDLSTVTVEARQPFSAASSTTARKFDLKVRPVRSAQDMLALVPGLLIAQHAGGGKAEQLFMRGFDADHGTDVGIYVDGIPVNMVTHGHGQGYADLHFIIPEIIDGLAVYKGPYFSRYGNFATAGSVELTTTEHPEKNLVKVEGGMFNTAKTTTVLKIPTNGKHQSAYIAAQYATTDGPLTNPQDFNRMNLFGKFHTHISPESELGISMSAFSSAWRSSGQIPVRAIENGLMTRWDAIDDLEGGVTGRYTMSVDYHFKEGYDHDFLVKAYYSKYDFKLYSNFTFWLNDPVNGDMIEQNDHRGIYGINTRYSFKKSFENLVFYTKLGATFRGDDISVSLWHSPSRQRLDIRKDDQVNEVNMAFWLEEDIILSPKFKVELGLRGDYFTFDVVNQLSFMEYLGFTGNGLPQASGYAQATIVSPKINLVWRPIRSIDIYLNGGSGFHSNDARDVIMKTQVEEMIHSGKTNGLSQLQIDQQLKDKNFSAEQAGIEILPRALGGEVGTRLSPYKWILVNIAGWYLHMEEELVYIGDEGSTEINGETRRLGVDVEARVQLAEWLWMDMDYNFADGRYINEPSHANYIPLAPRMTAQGGIDMLHPKGFEASLRFKYLADRPANEENTVTALGYFLTNVLVGYKFNGFRVFGQIENLLNAEWNEAQFDTESRLYNEIDAVTEIHFTPGNPFNVQIGLSYEF